MEAPLRPQAKRRRTSSNPRIRPRSQSVYPTSTPSTAIRGAALARSLTSLPPPSLVTAATGTVESLDLPTSLPALVASLRAFLLGHVREVEDKLRVLSEDIESSSASEEDDDGLLAPELCEEALEVEDVGGGGEVRSEGTSDGRVNKTSRKGKARQIIAPIPTETGRPAVSGHVVQFVAHVRAYLRSLKADLFTVENLPPSLRSSVLELSPAAMAALGELATRERRRPASFSAAQGAPQRPRLAWLGRSRSEGLETITASPSDSPLIPSFPATPSLTLSPKPLDEGTFPSSPTFCPSPTPLDEALGSPTVPSTFAIPDASHLLATLSAHSEKVQELLAQISLYCRTRSLSLPVAPSVSTAAPVFAGAKRLYDSVPSFSSMSMSIPSRPPLPSPAVALSSYFTAESERLAQLVGPLHLAERSQSVRTTLRAYRDEARTALHEGEERLREEKERLKEWVEGEGEKLKIWVDSEAEKFKVALRAGKDRLLSYQELPIDWRNNEYILSGYRFIPVERWRDLLLSGLQWHNETVNIHTHLIGSLSILYLLLAIWPSSPFSAALTPGSAPNPATSGATPTDRLVALAFIGCAFKCLVCSAAWHLFAGCASIDSFQRFACVDYVGISGLIAASVISIEYYGFYCRRNLAYAYMTFSAAMGVLGMIAPFRSWFDGPGGKSVRVAFFVSMACSSILPTLHMALLYGVPETVLFFRPIIPSIACYLGGLFFYVTNYPEKIRPGGLFDYLFHSHSLWHGFILAAIWLHWHALCSFHREGRGGFSCARSDDHLWDKVVRAVVVAGPHSSGATVVSRALGWVIEHL